MTERPILGKMGVIREGEVHGDEWRSFVVGCSHRGGHKSAEGGKLARCKRSPQGRGVRRLSVNQMSFFYPCLREHQTKEMEKVQMWHHCWFFFIELPLFLMGIRKECNFFINGKCLKSLSQNIHPKFWLMGFLFVFFKTNIQLKMKIPSKKREEHYDIIYRSEICDTFL